jgi:hypothetical protein
MNEYKSGDFCRSMKCPVRLEIDANRIDKRICETACVFSAWSFHDWLKKNHYKIMNQGP